MAKAVEQHIPGAWSLTDLLEYLTLAPFGYEIDAGLREMERCISTGELPLIDEEYVDGKLRARYKLNSFYFRTNYTLKFDYHDQVVRVVRQRMELGDGIVHRYFVLKQDAHRVWPPRPPKPVSTQELVTAAAIRLKKANKIPPKERQHPTDFAKLLRKAAGVDVGWEHIKNNLPAWGLWPIESIPTESTKTS